MKEKSSLIHKIVARKERETRVNADPSTTSGLKRWYMNISCLFLLRFCRPAKVAINREREGQNNTGRTSAVSLFEKDRGSDWESLNEWTAADAVFPAS